MRPSKRAADEMRSVTLDRGISKHAEGSCLVKFGDTHVLCMASLEDRVPGWLRGGGRGWVTAEYGMLPRATNERTGREAARGRQSGRTQEIQRLIGRSMRAVVDLTALGEKQITVDCDVVQADGGTRTASITGAWVALSDCLTWMRTREMIGDGVLKDHVAAVSGGIYQKTPVLVFTMHSDPVIVSRALEVGATGYVLKDTSPDEVLKAFQAVRDGRSYLSHDLALEVAFMETRGTTNPLKRMTMRELQTLTLIAEGKPYGVIAEHLHVSYKTVANTCTQLKAKLGVRTLPELMRIAIQYIPSTTVKMSKN